MEPVIVTLAILGLGFVTGFVVRDRADRRRRNVGRKHGV